MDKNDVTPKSEQKNETPSLDMSSVTDSSSLGSHQPPPDGGTEKKPESEPAPEARPSEGQPKVTEAPSEEKPTEEGKTLEERMSEGEAVTYKKIKHPKTTEEDLVNNGEKYEVRSQHTYNDIDKMFNVSGNVDAPNPKLFFSIIKNDPEGAERIAKACGWRSSHYMKAAIEDYVNASSEKERANILRTDFPEFVWSEEATPPFDVKISKNEVSTIQTNNTGVFGYAKSDVDAAINAYVADNNDVKKEDILKSVKVAKLLEEFSGLQRGGKQLSVNEALSMAIHQANIKKEPLEKSKKVSLGGGTNIKQEAKPTKGVSPGARALAERLGIKID